MPKRRHGRGKAIQAGKDQAASKSLNVQLQNLQAMFSTVDPDLVRTIWEECNFNVEEAIKALSAIEEEEYKLAWSERTLEDDLQLISAMEAASEDKKLSVDVQCPANQVNATSDSDIISKTTKPSGTTAEQTSIEFLQSMFDDLDAEFVKTVFDENSQNLERATESLLTMVFITQSGQESADAAANDSTSDATGANAQLNMRTSEEVTRNTTINSATDESTELLDIGEDFEAHGRSESESDSDNELATPIQPESDAGMAFRAALRSLREMFPHIPPSTLAAVLEDHNDNLDAAVEVFLAESSQSSRDRRREKKRRKQLQKLENQRLLQELPLNFWKPTPTITYVPTETRITSAAPTNGSNAVTPLSSEPNVTNHDDEHFTDLNGLSAKLKFQKLAEQFPAINRELLHSIFRINKGNLTNTLKDIAILFPIAPSPSPSSATSAAPPPSTHQPRHKTHRPSIGNDKPSITPKDTKSTQQLSNDDSIFKDDLELPPPLPPPREEKWRVSQSTRRRRAPANGIKKGFRYWRDRALNEAKLRNSLYMQATAAFMAGDAAEARRLSRLGREHHAMVKLAQSHAGDILVRHAVTMSERGDDTTVDLHGMQVAEAIEVLERLVLVQQLRYREGPREAERVIQVITGKGRHSVGKKARIRPAVIEFLERRKLKWREPSTGVIEVVIDR